RHLRGRGGTAWRAGIAAMGLAALAAAWALGAQPLPDSRGFEITRDALTAWLMVPPFRDPIAGLGQLTFGYGLLRLLADLLIAAARVEIPIVAGGSVVEDRRSGRLDELQLALVGA